MNRLILSFALVLGLAATSMAEQIGKITKFKGKAVIVNLDAATNITKVGQPVNKGDTIQTENGEVEVTFTDGALLKVSPYTTSLLEERKETKGLFKKKEEDVRRMTCFVGKMYFKSGKSDKKNYVQSPTAVCALRGTVVEFASDGQKQAYIKVIEGESDDIGSVLRDVLPNIGSNEALKNTIFKAIQDATNDPAGSKNPKVIINIDKAIHAIQKELQKSPDSNVRKYAKAAASFVEAKLKEAAAKAKLDEATTEDEKETAQEELDKATEMVQEAKDVLVAEVYEAQ